MRRSPSTGARRVEAGGGGAGGIRGKVRESRPLAHPCASRAAAPARRGRRDSLRLLELVDVDPLLCPLGLRLAFVIVEPRAGRVVVRVLRQAIFSIARVGGG